MLKGFVVRIFPTKDQEVLLFRNINASRFIYNYMLEEQNKRHVLGQKHLSEFDMKSLLSSLVKEEKYSWLRDVGMAVLRTACKDLSRNFQKFFDRKSGKPKFKSKKRAKASFGTRGSRTYFSNGFVQIECIGKIRYKTDFILPQNYEKKIVNPRIKYVCGKWILSFCLECESQALELNDFSVGIDLGIKDLAVVSYNNEKLVYHNINKSHRIRTIERNLKILQRKVARKYEKNKKGCVYVKTNNIRRCENKIRRLYARLTNIRQDYIHKITKAIINLRPSRVVMEDINIRGLMKNKHLSKSISNQKWHEFIRQVKYKCEWNGIKFIQADRFFASSKTCSVCGNKKHDLKLSDRVYKCDCCGSVIDRDFNAAINLMRYEI